MAEYFTNASDLFSASVRLVLLELTRAGEGREEGREGVTSLLFGVHSGGSGGEGASAGHLGSAATPKHYTAAEADAGRVATHSFLQATYAHSLTLTHNLLTTNIHALTLTHNLAYSLTITLSLLTQHLLATYAEAHI